VNEEKRLGVSTNELVFEQTALSHDTTLTAWLRTAISLMSFGFTIYEFFQESSATEAARYRLLTPRLVGLVMICFGLLSLLLAHIEHRKAIKKIRKSYPNLQKSGSALLSSLVLLFGVTLFLAALFRQ
jgi:putative membrane protein